MKNSTAATVVRITGNINFPFDIDMMQYRGKNFVETERKADRIRIIKPEISDKADEHCNYHKQLNSFASDSILSRIIF